MVLYNLPYYIIYKGKGDVAEQVEDAQRQSCQKPHEVVFLLCSVLVQCHFGSVGKGKGTKINEEWRKKGEELCLFCGESDEKVCFVVQAGLSDGVGQPCLCLLEPWGEVIHEWSFHECRFEFLEGTQMEG